MIFFTTVVFALIFINSAVVVDLQDTDPFGCSIRANTSYKQAYVFIQACIVSVIPPCMMFLFGLMTIYNIKKARIAPVAITHDRRTKNQLIRMLLLQAGTHIVLNLPSSITYLMFVLPNTIKYTPDFLVASLFSVLPFHTSYVTAFFLYVLSAKVYRRELIRLVHRIFQSNARNQVHPFADIKNTMPMGSRSNANRSNRI